MLFIKELKEQFPNFKYTYTGHSMGGLLACTFSELFNESAIVFNPYIDNYSKKYKSDITAFIHEYDLLSYGCFNKLKYIYIPINNGYIENSINYHKLVELLPNYRYTIQEKNEYEEKKINSYMHVFNYINNNLLE